MKLIEGAKFEWDNDPRIWKIGQKTHDAWMKSFEKYLKGK